MEQILVVNVGGTRHETFRSTLNRFPKSRLARLNSVDPSYNQTTREYFFDRNPKLFTHLLDYYRTGELHFPHCLCGPAIQNELRFWQIDETQISPCCWRAYREYDEEKAAMEVLETAFEEQTKDINNVAGEKRSWRDNLWGFLENPKSSNLAKIWAIAFLTIVILSIATLCMGTHPVFRVPLRGHRRNITNVTNTKMLLLLTTDLHPLLTYFEVFATVVFFLELLLRFAVCRQKKMFFLSIYNITDMLCILPMAVTLFLEFFIKEIWTDESIFLFYFYVSVLSVFRSIRLIKFARHYHGMRVLLLAIRASAREILLLCLLILIGTLVFSTLIYFAEFNQENNFTTIPIGFWWAIVTMTTVGYGDKHPKSGWGYIVGAMCALTGMLSTGLPIPVIASNFTMYYNYAKRKGKMENNLNKRTELRESFTCRSTDDANCNDKYVYENHIVNSQTEQMNCRDRNNAPGSSPTGNRNS